MIWLWDFLFFLRISNSYCLLFICYKTRWKTEYDRQWQTTTDNHRQQQPTTDNNRQQQTMTDNDRQRQTTTDNNKQQQTTTDNNRQQQTTTDNDRQWLAQPKKSWKLYNFELHPNLQGTSRSTAQHCRCIPLVANGTNRLVLDLVIFTQNNALCPNRHVVLV